MDEIYSNNLVLVSIIKENAVAIYKYSLIRMKIRVNGFYSVEFSANNPYMSVRRPKKKWSDLWVKVSYG